MPDEVAAGRPAAEQTTFFGGDAVFFSRAAAAVLLADVVDESVVSVREDGKARGGEEGAAGRRETCEIGRGRLERSGRKQESDGSSASEGMVLGCAEE